MNKDKTLTVEKRSRCINNGKESFPLKIAVWTALALFAASMEPLVVKLGYRSAEISPYQLLYIRAIMASLIIYPLTRSFRWIGWKKVLRIASVGVMLLITNACNLIALKRISAILAMTLVSCTPAIVALGSYFQGRVILTYRYWIGFGSCFIGVLLAVNVTDLKIMQGEIIGILFILGAVASSAIYRIRMDRLTKEFESLLISTYIFWINSSILIIILSWSVWPLPEQIWGYGMWIGFSTALANVAFLSALHSLGSTKVSIFAMLQRPIVMTFTALILKERLSVSQIIGIGLVLFGVCLAKVTKTSKHPGSR